MGPDRIDEARREKLLRSLHPDRVRARERRWCWARVVVFLALTAGACAGALRALGAQEFWLAAFAALLCLFCGCTFIVLLGVAVAKELAHWLQGRSPG